ncbi:MAG TPA: ABC transporter permease [Vicinamibacterales bacterium]
MARWRRFRQLFGPEPRGDVDAELSFHLEMRTRELIARGETPERARELAMQRFGDYDSSHRECVAIDERRGRTMARVEYLRELKQDASYALRTLRRSPGFTAVALLTLALGVGANSAIFSVVYGVLLRPLPYPAPEQLFRVRMLYPDGTEYSAISAPDFMSLRQDTRVFERVEAYGTGLFTLLGDREPREVRGATVSDGLFDLLGMRVAAGRAFRPEEFVEGAGNVAVLDHGFWERGFGSDPSVIGRTVKVGGRPVTIVGVLAKDARLTAPADMYAPLERTANFSAATAAGRRSEYLGVVGRARAGMGLEQVLGDVQRVGRELQTAFPNTNGNLTFSAISLTDLVVGDVRRPLFMLLGAVGFVLLVACANVANLLLARASARQQEFSVRGALGATTSRLVRQLLTEALVLGLAGSIGGLAVAYWATHALVAAQPADIPRVEQIGLQVPVVLYTIAIALITAMAFGLLPALQAARGVGLSSGLRETSRGGGAGARGHRMRAGLVVAEMALAVVLLMGAGLLIRSFVAMMRVNPGFRPDGAIAFRMALQGESYQRAEQIRNRVTEIEGRLRALPGVSAVAVTTILPMSGAGSLVDFAVDGAPPPPPNVNQEIAMGSVTPDYFAAVGTPLLRGRIFGDRDSADVPRVAIINEAAIRRWFPGQDPLGRRVSISGAKYEIVGVVADILQEEPGQPAIPQLFAPYAQRTVRSPRFVIRASGDPVQLGPAIREAVRGIDPNLAIPEIIPLERLISTSVARPRFYTSLLVLFAGVALALAATGIFGVMSYSVAQRSREISIRMALGAHAPGVLWMILRRGIALAGTGLLIGIVVTLLLARLLRAQLFGVGIVDPITLAAVAVVLCLSAALASVLPARRAARLDPGMALREG